MKRRVFLKGLGGVTLALPILPSLLPRVARAAAPQDRRFAIFLTCNGVNQERFWPAATSGAINASSLTQLVEGQLPTVAELASVAQHITICRGVYGAQTFFGNNDHGRGITQALTAAPRPEGQDHAYPLGPSIDIEIAKLVGGRGIPLNLGVMNGSGGPHNYMSYTGTPGSIAQPVAAENNPRFAYEDLMGLTPEPVGGSTNPGGSGTTPGGPVDLVFQRRMSVLDLVGRKEFESLVRRRISANDRQRLLNHFDAVREIENQLTELDPPGTGTGGGTGAGGAGGDPGSCGLEPDVQTEIEAYNGGSDYPKIGRLQMNILAMALACGYYRVGTLMWGSESGGPAFTWLGHTVGHHQTSHRSTAHSGGEGTLADGDRLVYEIDRWHAQQFAYFVERLDAYGILEQTAAVWAHTIGHGLDHSHWNLPYIVAGGLDGYLKTGQVVNAPSCGGAQNRLWTTIMRGMGISPAQAPDFGTLDDRCEFWNYGGEHGELDVLKA